VSLKKQQKIYWICQFSGWVTYSLINLVFFELSTKSTLKDYLLYLLIVPSGLLISHSYRFILQRLNALKLSLYFQLLLAIISSLIKASVLFALLALFTSLFNLGKADFSFINTISSIINFSVVFFIWNTFYFAYHYFINYKQAEIDTFKLQAAQKESELNSLKSQLNPHFMFNSMNSIRALVDEDPQKAKKAVTQLSNILRNSLLLNKNRTIPLKEEILLVQDFLELEKIRYEERLHFKLTIHPETENILIPPFIIQGLVENAIKHGISKLTEGGIVEIETSCKGKILLIKVGNTGVLNREKTETGVGMNNTSQRLKLIYGNESHISITEQNNKVIVEINIPLLKSPS
jgi:two-component system, LytTR family, sensor kinase